VDQLQSGCVDIQSPQHLDAAVLLTLKHFKYSAIVVC